MPAEYRCDGACRRILSDLGDYWDEIDRKYCVDDYPRVLAARAAFQTAVQATVDNALVEFQKTLGNFITPPLVPEIVVFTLTTKLAALPKTNKTATEIKPPKP